METNSLADEVHAVAGMVEYLAHVVVAQTPRASYGKGLDVMVKDCQAMRARLESRYSIDGEDGVREDG